MTVQFINFVFQYLYSFGCALETGDDARRTGYIYVMTSFRLPFPLNRRGKNMAHPVLVHFNQLQSALMSNPSGFLSAPVFCLHIHENICSCISGENPMLLDYRSLFGRCLSVGRSKHNLFIEHIDMKPYFYDISNVQLAVKPTEKSKNNVNIAVSM